MYPASVSLRLITKEDEVECIALRPREDQVTWVASNLDSLLHAVKEVTSKPYGIYANELMVGLYCLIMKYILMGITGYLGL